ncbi:ROK family protein [Paenibacillus sp. GCM10027626]|uniref:ROK family protein n=1 Tax=Paenibacillus sp. GCM10027626 TaxID=3273411 RepID=UPI00363F25C6
MATCGNILNELLQSGEALELELEESSGGRPARRYKLNADYSYIACLYVKSEGGVHSMTYGVANLLGELVEEQTSVLEGIEYDSIEHQLDALIERHGNIKAIGIGIPGVVNNGVIGVCDIAALSGRELGAELKGKYGLEVTVENDMNLTVYGFYRLQNFDAEQTFAVVTLAKDTFPGAGFIVNGNILRGNTHFAGEVSYLPFALTREEQLKRTSTSSGFLPLAVQITTSIAALINPVSIALTGELSSEELMEEIYAGCLQYIPQEHMPELLVKKNTHDEYLHGLVSVTLESLACNFQLVEKRI